jgi:hypothetical protein
MSKKLVTTSCVDLLAAASRQGHPDHFVGPKDGLEFLGLRPDTEDENPVGQMVRDDVLGIRQPP